MTAPQIGPLIGSGNVAEAFEYGDAVIKLYRDPEASAPAFIEAAVLAIVADHDLPAPAVREVGHYNGRWGLVMDRAPGEPLARFAQDQPAQVPDVLDAMVQLHLRVHRQPEARLPSLKARIAERISRAPGLSAATRENLLARLAALPDGDRLCHGDFHPFNIIGLPGQAMIIDWLDATCGPPAADVCRSFLLMVGTVPELAENYLDRYAAVSGIDRTEILAWLPCLAAARLCEGVATEAGMLLQLATEP